MAVSKSSARSVSTLGASSFSVIFGTFLTDCSSLSHAPPAFGYPWQLKRYSMFLAPTKLVPLSHRIGDGVPRKFHRLQIHTRQASVDKSAAISKCTALTVMEVNSATQRFLWCLPTVTATGPKKSSPVFVNYRTYAFYRSRGSCPWLGRLGLGASIRHVSQWLRTERTNDLCCGTQNLDCTAAMVASVSW